MPKGIFFTIPARGHVNPALELIASLLRAGGELTVYSEVTFRSRIEATGARFCPYPERDERESFATLPGKMGHLARSLAEANLRVYESEIERLKSLAPDFVVHDSIAVWGKYVAETLRVPAVCLSTMLVPTPTARRIGWRSGYRMGGLGEVAASMRHAFAAVGAGIRFQRRTGMKSPGLFGLFTAYEKLNVVCTSREFQPGGDVLDDSWFFAGPALEEEPAGPGDEPISVPDATPLIVLSAGTIFSTDLAYFRSALAALRGIEAFVVVSTGGAFAPEALDDVPENVLVRQNVPFIDLLRNARLFIGHGGIGSMSKAFASGVPSVVVPQVLEQTVTARRAEELGAAICILRHKLTPKRLRAAIDAILADDSYRANAAKIGETFRSAPGMDEAAARILDYARTGRADRT